jgi:hypothetical protein
LAGPGYLLYFDIFPYFWQLKHLHHAKKAILPYPIYFVAAVFDLDKFLGSGRKTKKGTTKGLHRHLPNERVRPGHQWVFLLRRFLPLVSLERQTGPYQD